jgi:zinc carboxypeptidase
MSFRKRYLDYAELTAQVQAWAKAHPRFVRLESIGKSAEGRDLWLLTIGTEPERTRPAIWIDGNMHASELCGSSVALAIAEDAIRAHLEPREPLHGLPEHVSAVLRGVLFHVLPRMSPDGAEAVLKSGRYVRSVPRDARPNKGHSRWISGDVDGDGLALHMRREDPTGEFVASSEVEGLLVQRRLEHPGPYYKLYPEGTIENFDGVTVPNPYFLSDNEPDLNRNFPYQWSPEPKQVGAGRLPLSEPESAAVADAATKRPHLFAWLNLHTFGGVHIRPLGDAPDSKMDQGDLALFRQITAWADEFTGYPTVSGYEEFLYEPDKPLYGDLSDFAYHQRGCIAWACELWDLFRQVGLEKKKRFVDQYVQVTEADLVKIAKWDKEHNAGRSLPAWRKVRHPQLGEVEVGGMDPRIGLWNPPPDKIDDVCRRMSALMMRVAAMAPALAFGKLAVESVGQGLHRLEVRVENRGYLATYVLPSAKKLPWNEPLHADITAEGGCQLVAPHEAHRELGHLDGWGRGLFDGTSALGHMQSRGSTSAKTAAWVLRGKGRVKVRVGSCRVGYIENTIDIS